VDARLFVEDLAARVGKTNRLQITSDGHRPCLQRVRDFRPPDRLRHPHQALCGAETLEHRAFNRTHSLRLGNSFGTPAG
jgi:hypothetical protein